MIQYSEELRTCSTRLITFSGAAFALKVIPLNAVSISDVNISLGNVPVAIGMINVFAIYLLISYVILLLRDYQKQKNLDLMEFSATNLNIPAAEVGRDENDLAIGAERYQILSIIHVFLHNFFPILFGLFVIVFTKSDLFTFAEHLVYKISTEFGLIHGEVLCYGSVC